MILDEIIMGSAVRVVNEFNEQDQQDFVKLFRDMVNVKEDLQIFDELSLTLSKIQKDIDRRKSIVTTDIFDVDVAIENAFSSGKTPLVLDPSPDAKLLTFFSYQPDVCVLGRSTYLLS